MFRVFLMKKKKTDDGDGLTMRHCHIYVFYVIVDKTLRENSLRYIT